MKDARQPAKTFTPDELSSVQIDWHIAGNVAWIDMLTVPEAVRRTGLGSAAYLAWEKALPKEVRLVRIFAADTDGSGNSDDFWNAQGFDYTYSGEESDLSYEAAHDMRKGVNGRRTPKAIKVEPADES